MVKRPLLGQSEGDLCQKGGPTLRRSSTYRSGHGPTWTPCEWEGDVVAVVAPLGGVAQVVSHGVKVVGVHGEEGKEKDEEVRREVKGEVEENQGRRRMDGMWMKVKDSRTT